MYLHSEVHFAHEIETRLSEVAAKSGRSANEFVEDAMANYLDDISEVRTLLDSRYHEIINGKVTPVDGEAFFLLRFWSGTGFRATAR